MRNILFALAISLTACAATPPSDGTSIDVTSDDKADGATRTLTQDIKAHWLTVSTSFAGMTAIDSSDLPGPHSQATYDGIVAMELQAYKLKVDGKQIYAIWSNLDGDPIDVLFYDATDRRLTRGEGNDYSNVWHWYR